MYYITPIDKRERESAPERGSVIILGVHVFWAVVQRCVTMALAWQSVG